MNWVVLACDNALKAGETSLSAREIAKNIPLQEGQTKDQLEREVLELCEEHLLFLGMLMGTRNHATPDSQFVIRTPREIRLWAQFIRDTEEVLAVTKHEAWQRIKERQTSSRTA